MVKPPRHPDHEKYLDKYRELTGSETNRGLCSFNIK